jgi:hypothetical protein
MADVASTRLPSSDAAEQGLAYLAEMSPDVRGGAIVGAGGEVLAASGDHGRWAETAAGLLAAADAAGGEPVEQVHVATENGEVFALRQADLTAIVVTERFVLASLMAFDMRSVLRDLSPTAASPAETG